MLITNDLWQLRTRSGVDFTSRSELSAGRGLPVVVAESWAEKIRIELPTLPQALSRVNAAEKQDGWEYELSADQKLRYRNVRSIDLPDGTRFEPERGAIRVDFTFDRRPATNVFALKLTLPKAALLLYQPALTLREIDGGDTRPAWCVDSWACYAADGRKLGHIPRPWARDADGKWCWGTWRRNGSMLAKVIPQAWLDAAKYPILVDDTFGITAIGGSGGSWNYDRLYAPGPFVPDSSGTLDEIYMYLDPGQDGLDYTFGCYDDSGGDPNNLVGDSAGGTASGAYQWLKQDVSGSLTGSNDYWLAQNHDVNYLYYKYDVNAAYKQKYKTAISYVSGTLPDPFPASPSQTTSRKISAYGIYTPSGGGFGGSNTIIGGGIVA